MAEKATLAERLSSWVKLGLLAALPLYLLVDAAMANLRPGYHRHKAEQRELLCLRPVDAEGQVMLAAEAERRANQPVSALGKLHLFLTCADMTKVDALGFEVAVAERTRLAETQAVAETTAPIQARVAELEDRAAEIFGPGSAEQAELAEVASALQEDVKRQRAATEELVARAEVVALPEAQRAGNWYLVAGADRTLDAAIRQARAVDRLVAEADVAHQGVRLLQRDDFLRTVVIFPTRDAARAALDRLQDDLPYGGYVRAVADWCPDPSPGDVVDRNLPILTCA